MINRSIEFQSAALILRDAKMNSHSAQYPLELSDGNLRINDKTYQNTIPIPLNISGEITIEFIATSDITIHAKSIELELIGDEEFLEEFSG